MKFFFQKDQDGWWVNGPAIILVIFLATVASVLLAFGLGSGQ